MFDLKPCQYEYLNCIVPGLIDKEGIWVVKRKGFLIGAWSDCEIILLKHIFKVCSDILDDEDDPAEAEKEGNEMEGEELDPLDAYMEEVKEEVKKFNMRSVKENWWK